MKAVVVGGAGFIGSAIAKRLDGGLEAAVVDDFSSGYMENLEGFKGKVVRASVLEEHRMNEVLRDADVIFHLAAMNCLPECSDQVAKAMDVNVRGTAILLEAARRVASKNVRFVFTSSSAVYEGSDRLPSREDDALNPSLTYAVSKLQGEFLCRSFYRAFGIPYSVIRPFNVYGEGQDFRRPAPPVLSAFAKELLQGRPGVIYGDGQQARDFVHVEDAVDLFLLAGSHPKAVGEAFNCGTGNSLSVRELYRLVSEDMGVKMDPEFKEPSRLFDSYPELQQGNFPFRDELVAHEASKTTQADVSKAKELLGWQPKVSIRDGVRRSTEYIRRYS